MFMGHSWVRLLILMGALIFPVIVSASVDNSAQINIQSSVSVMSVQINGGAGGCGAGQQWDIFVGGCTTPVVIGNTSRSCACSCGSGMTGSCTRSQSGTLYGWRIPPSGASVVSNTVWGSCQQTSSSCQVIVPPTPPSTTIAITGMICNSWDAGYYSSPSVPDTYRTQIIGKYRSWGSGGRCPERGGYQYWLSDLDTRAKAMGGSPTHYAMVWATVINGSIDTASYANDERGYGGVRNANAACQSAAYSRGYFGTATYIPGTGNLCIVYL